jgi:DNA (cytosine-5)-methyltransferase 1
MPRPRLLDLFSGAGGCAVGYDRAGFDVVGVDNRPQPRYPFAFVQADALEYAAAHGSEYDAIHASPPCQGYSRMRYATGGTSAPKLIAETRAALIATGRPYVIENVVGAPLVAYTMLCGTMFGLRVRRHRLFETAPLLPLLTPPCSCKHGVRDGRLIGARLRGPKPPGRIKPPRFTDRELRSALGVDWMTIVEAGQAIPPAMTAFIGAALAATLSTAAV